MRRRLLLLGAPALLAAAAPGDDGLFHESWFLASFLDLRDDRDAARKAGRHLAVLWELRGCPACRQLHERTLSDPAVVAAMRARVDVVLLDIIGARPVTGLDRVALPEKALAKAWNVPGTPTLMVVPGGPRQEGFVDPRGMIAWLDALPAIPAA